MGTHPIFESDFDCLTDLFVDIEKLWQIFPIVFANYATIHCSSSRAMKNRLMMDTQPVAIVSRFLLNVGGLLPASAHDVCRSTSEKKWVFKNNLIVNLQSVDKKLKNTSI